LQSRDPLVVDERQLLADSASVLLGVVIADEIAGEVFFQQRRGFRCRTGGATLLSSQAPPPMTNCENPVAWKTGEVRSRDGNRRFLTG
jgi:hypothetical protein